jgi:hypothetical protein
MRPEGWELRLAAVVEAARLRPFDWRSHNCVLFAASCVEAVTGNNPAAGRRPVKRGKSAAYAALDAAAPDVEAAATLFLGEPRNPLLAQRGDVVSLDTPMGVALAVCLGARCAHPSPDGLEFRPLTQARQSWRV